MLQEAAAAASILSACCTVLLYPIARVLFDIQRRLTVLETLERERNAKAQRA